MKAILVDDEPKHSAQLHKLLLKYFPSLEIAAIAETALAAKELIRFHNPDIVFLDIVLPGRNAFDMLSDLSATDDINFKIIFVSGYDQYGVKAIKYSALDYILKPVKPEDLVAAVNKAQRTIERESLGSQVSHLLEIIKYPNRNDHKIALPLSKGVRLVSPAEIIRMETENNYTRFFLDGGEKLLISRGMYEYEELLEPFGFIRCHHSHLVNIRFVRSMEKGDVVHELVLKKGERVPVATRRVGLVRDKFLSTAITGGK